MMDAQRPGISEQELQHLIDVTPRAYRRELIELIRNVEVALELTDLAAHSWKEALDSYRARVKAVTPAGHAKVGVLFLDPGLVAYLRKLDDVFRRIHDFKPEEFMTKPMKSTAARVARTGQVLDENQRAKELIVSLGYLTAKRGQKKSIKSKIQEKTGLSPRHIDDLISAVKQQRK